MIPIETELKEKILEPGEKVPFKPYTQEYGVAEFSICTVREEGEITKIVIWPHQQPDADRYYVILVEHGPKHLTVQSWTHKGLEEPRHWRTIWCEEHECPAQEWYAPRDSNVFNIRFYGHSVNITFDRISADSNQNATTEGESTE